jgi:hypothetical protein
MEILNPSYPQLAPLFHYYVTRFENRGAKADGFLILEAGLTTLSRNGMCREQLHAQPYTETGISTKPSAEAYADATARALRNRGLLPRYKQAQGPSKVAWIREQLKQNCPIILGFQLPIGYPQFLLSPKFEWLSPDSPPRSMTGHCVLVTGYDDTRQALHIQDSLGEGAFDKGCWWMGYPVVNSTVVSQVYSLIP